ncbi:MAG: D-inositol-3-phosphate glycosyltransferase [Actinobacteria bacterium]|nr:D-inositol-3-phosphate glycosyltransferase [Actinomycetota bacterium]MCO5300026.1 D-inositol-3-phosphate glycosyltransferase [Candidatus Nanopelagicales bacterium]MCB9429123.1 D-inositol-3-phosphate glycosyltransferase [Actinomycetota bacterium]HPE12401.1 D-inositol-3-phosphate glycosyltransferase [Actinomycetota bacterium]HPJ19033.1 D-inositol-3-phosphate glycosyltransferase [Actinomycetota bacterium]
MHDARRVAMISMHTSPLATPGSGDAGGMNVYVLEVAKELAKRSTEVEIFTRATSSEQPPQVSVTDGVTVHHVSAGPYEGLRKEQLPAQMCAFTASVLHAEAYRPEGYYDIVHSHYWLSGQVGWVAAERWQIPLLHSMHTMAKVKNLTLAAGDAPEPFERVMGEEQVVAAADGLIANTETEAEDLIALYDADPTSITVALPGVDLGAFTPGSQSAARHRYGFDDDDVILLFVGRIQPLKAPDVLVAAAAQLLAQRPELRPRLKVVINGGPSGSGIERAGDLPALIDSLGMGDVVRMMDPVSRDALPDLYRAADLVVVPSYSESFGLVAVEAQACGTPVVASRVGGLTTAVADAGILVAGHDPRDYATALEQVLLAPSRLSALSLAARDHAEQFSWAATADATREAYHRSLDSRPVLLRRYA